MSAADIFNAYAEQMADFVRADRLHHALVAHCNDGTEIHHVVDHQLRGLEQEASAAAIKRALKAHYADTIRITDAIEIICKLLEEGELA
jgi:hypothetical protein